MSPDPNSAEARLAKFQRVFPRAWLARDIYGGSELIRVEFPPDLDELCDVHIIMEHQSGRIYAEANTTLDEETTTVVLRKGLNAPDGLYQARIRPKAVEYYGATPYEHALPFHVIKGDTSTSYYGDAASRREEALTDAVRRGPTVISELARLARGDVVRDALLIEASESGDPRALLALHVISGKYGRDLPLALAAELNSNLHRVNYSALGATPMALACRRLAGTRYKQADRAADETKAWLHQRARDGFDFSADLADELMALAALAALDDDHSELAAVVLDKLLFSLALHPTDFARDARLSPLSPATRLLWGTGNWNHENAAAVMLACLDEYEAPSIIQAIAVQPQLPYSAADAFRCGKSLTRRQVYRGTHGTLVSVGSRWLAELGQARVFSEGENDALRQRGEVLSCLSSSPIYFPICEFDDWSIGADWAFARVAEGYLALHSSGGVRLREHGARRDRLLGIGSEGSRLTIRLGSASSDGDFDAFVERLSGQQPPVEAPGSQTDLHYDSPYCRAEFDQAHLEIRYDKYVMQLDLSIESEPAE